VVHIPEILYHWRASEKSTSINHQEKHYADDAGRNCVADALARRGIDGEVLGCEWKFFYRAKRAVQPKARVTLVIDWRRHQPQNRDISSLVATAGATISKILILTTDIKETPLPEVGNEAPGLTFKLLSFPRGRSTASVFAEIANTDDSDYLAWLDGSLHPQSNQWLSALLEYGQSQEVAMVRGLLDCEPQDHPAITPIADTTQQSPRYFARFLADCSVLMNGGQCAQEVMAVVGDVFLLRTTWLHTHPELMKSEFLESFFFLDLSMRLHQCGAKNIYTPYCNCAVVSASNSAGLEDVSSLSIEEQRRFQAHWAEVLAGTIPFYNTRIIGDANHSEENFRRWLTGKGL
jgi:O-antigen biosynthesis protein